MNTSTLQAQSTASTVAATAIKTVLVIVCVALVLFIIGGFLSMVTPSGYTSETVHRQAAVTMKSIHLDVAKDYERQYYNIAVYGSKAEKCAYAGMVSAAWNQANNMNKFREWKRTENRDCN